MTFSERLIHLAEHLDCHLCFTSSDLVFEASNPQGGGFTERDQPSCWSRYAKGKLATERLVGGLGANGLSLRVCLVYGAPKGDARGNLAWILDALSDNRQVRLFCDEWRTPIYVSSLAHIIAISLETRASGLLHCGGTERVSRFEMGQALCQVMDFPEQLLLSVPQPVDGVPRRPSDVCLNSEQLYRSLGYIPMTLYDAYKQMRSELGG